MSALYASSAVVLSVHDMITHVPLRNGYRDTRMAWIQMEALAGLPTQNDWDRHYNGYTNSPFIKSNYPHPAGTWSWGTDVDQVTFTIQFIRRS